MRLIDADALMNELEREVALADDWKTAHEIANCVKYATTVEPKKARWIRLEGMAPPEYHGHKICSACECMAPYDPLHIGREILTPYCPGCGAKMEVQNETD